MAQHRKLPVVIDAVLYDGNLVGGPSATDPSKVEPLTCPDWFPALQPVVGDPLLVVDGFDVVDDHEPEES